MDANQDVKMNDRAAFPRLRRQCPAGIFLVVMFFLERGKSRNSYVNFDIFEISDVCLDFLERDPKIPMSM